MGRDRGREGRVREGREMCRLLGQSIKKSTKITVAYKCAHSEHIS